MGRLNDKLGTYHGVEAPPSADDLNLLNQGNRQIVAGPGVNISQFGDRVQIESPDKGPRMPDIGRSLGRFVVLQEFDDHLYCAIYRQTNDGQQWTPPQYEEVRGEDDSIKLYVAKPDMLRRGFWDGRIIDNVRYEHVALGQRNAFVRDEGGEGEEEEGRLESIRPSYFKGDIIWATYGTTGQIGPDNKVMGWTDNNHAARVWFRGEENENDRVTYNFYNGDTINFYGPTINVRGPTRFNLFFPLIFVGPAPVIFETSAKFKEAIFLDYATTTLNAFENNLVLPRKPVQRLKVHPDIPSGVSVITGVVPNINTGTGEAWKIFNVNLPSENKYIVLTHLDGASLEQNRWELPNGDYIVLRGGEGGSIWYDPVVEHHRFELTCCDTEPPDPPVSERTGALTVTLEDIVLVAEGAITFGPTPPVVIDDPGIDEWVSPITGTITVEAFGAGGGGNAYDLQGGPGGGGGGYGKGTYSVVMGVGYPIQIGVGGAGGIGNGTRDGANGTDTWFNSSTDIRGGGGFGAVGASKGLGSTTNNGNIMTANGGDSLDGGGVTGKGGGESGSSTGDGYAGGDPAGGDGGDGGDGGAGGSGGVGIDAPGIDGTIPGGGGGGTGPCGSNPISAGNGAGGRIIITL